MLRAMYQMVDQTTIAPNQAMSSIVAFDGRRGLWIILSTRLPDAWSMVSRFELDGAAPSDRYPRSLVSLSIDTFKPFCLIVTVCNRLIVVWLLCVIMMSRFVHISV